MQSERTVLLLFILIFSINGLHSSSAFRHNSLGALSDILRKDSRSPLVVVVNTAQRAAESDEKTSGKDDRYFVDNNDNMKSLYNALIKDNYQSVLYEILRSNKPADNGDENNAREILIEKALRQRCQAKVECEEKCSRSEERKPKRERFCQKSCKAVFDHLLNCPPPGNKKKEKQYSTTHSCGFGNGKTMPPEWRF